MAAMDCVHVEHGNSLDHSPWSPWRQRVSREAGRVRGSQDYFRNSMWPGRGSETLRPYCADYGHQVAVHVWTVLAVLMVAAGGRARTEQDCGAQIENVMALLNQQKGREAQQLALTATKACPREPAAYNMLGMTYDLENRFGEAQQAYRQAISLDPNVAAFHDNLAVCYMRSGNPEEGVREFQRALKLDPHNQTANWNLGAYCLSQKAYQRALDYSQRALAINPNLHAVRSNVDVLEHLLDQQRARMI